MPTLEEYLGGIMVSLSRARVMADVQAVETAQHYAKHDLLQHFAVPRLRFSDVELSIPVALDALGTTPPRAQLAPGDHDRVSKEIVAQLPKLLGLRSLSVRAATVLRATIGTHLDTLSKDLQVAPSDRSLDHFATLLTEQIVRTAATGQVKAAAERIDRTAMTGAIREAAAGAVTRPPGAATAGQVDIIAESHRLREQRPSDIITIKLKVSEDGVEWHQIERSDGTVERKLLPE